MSERGRQAGVSLIEVLIALVVLSLGLLGIAGLQSAGMQTSTGSYQDTQAVQLAQGMLERMRANRLQVIAGAYDRAYDASAPADPPVNCASAACTAAQEAAWDLAVFYAMVAGQPTTAYTNIPAGPTAVLPSARFSIVCADSSCTATSPHLITVYWDANRTAPDPATPANYDCAAANRDHFACYRLTFVP